MHGRHPGTYSFVITELNSLKLDYITQNHEIKHLSVSNLLNHVMPLVFLYLLKTSQNQKFSDIQGVQKETSGVKWANNPLIIIAAKYCPIKSTVLIWECGILWRDEMYKFCWNLSASCSTDHHFFFSILKAQPINMIPFFLNSISLIL